MSCDTKIDQIAFISSSFVLLLFHYLFVCLFVCLFVRVDLLKECWRRRPEDRPEPQTIVDLLKVHPEMITACLDCPSSSVPVVEEELNMVLRSSGRGTPSPSSRRSRTLSQLSQEHFRIFRTSPGSFKRPSLVLKNGSKKASRSRNNEEAV